MCKQVTYSEVHQLYNDPQDEYMTSKTCLRKNTQVTGFITMCAYIDTHMRVCARAHTHTHTHTHTTYIFIFISLFTLQHVPRVTGRVTHTIACYISHILIHK